MFTYIAHIRHQNVANGGTFVSGGVRFSFNLDLCYCKYMFRGSEFCAYYFGDGERAENVRGKVPVVL